MRLAILLHRYLGIAVGLIVSLWCLSAFVMMYVQYPELTDAERVAGLAPLDLSGCCATTARSRPQADNAATALYRADADVQGPRAGAGATLPDWLGTAPLEGFRFEMLGDAAVLRLYRPAGQAVVDLSTGRSANGLDAAAAAAVNAAYLRRLGIEADVTALGAVERDQWTVYSSYHPHRPLYRFAAADAAGTQSYVSAPTGEVVQITTARERLFSWFGSVTHWIYFTALRQHTAVWAQTVIWLTLVALALTVLGIYIGIKRLKRRRNGRLSPYRGFLLWHHYSGLVFGALILTWLVSGFFSMNPWGLLEGRSFAAERERLRGGELAPRDALAALRAVSGGTLPPGTVRVDAALLDGHLALVAWDRVGHRTRLDATSLAPRALGKAELEAAAARLRPEEPIAHQAWLYEDDAYYYSHHVEAELPVYRIRFADGERFYLDAVSGELALGVDATRQWYRWLFEALHRGDFSRLVRSRPLWDLLLWPLLLGVTLGAVTGTYLGVRRLCR